MISLTLTNTLTYTVTVAFTLVYYTPLKKIFLIVLSYGTQKKMFQINGACAKSVLQSYKNLYGTPAKKLSGIPLLCSQTP